MQSEGSLAPKLCFHIFNSWNSKEASHQSFVFTSSTFGIGRKPRTKLRVHKSWMRFECYRIWTKHCVFQVNGAPAAEKSRLAWAHLRGWSRVSRTARLVELMVPGDFLYFLMMLCYCVLHVLTHFVHWKGCVEEMWSHLQLLEFASRFLLAAAACVILLRFAAGSCKSLRGAGSCAAHVHGSMLKSLLF